MGPGVNRLTDLGDSGRWSRGHIRRWKWACVRCDGIDFDAVSDIVRCPCRKAGKSMVARGFDSGGAMGFTYAPPHDDRRMSGMGAIETRCQTDAAGVRTHAVVSDKRARARSLMGEVVLALTTMLFHAGLYIGAASCALAAEPGPAAQMNDRRGAERFLTEWFDLEERQKYSEMYPRLSQRYREELRKTENVRNPAGYERLRRSSEARWFGFKVREIKVASQSRVGAVVSATVEETGERESVEVRCVLKKEAGRWTLDDWH